MKMFSSPKTTMLGLGSLLTAVGGAISVYAQHGAAGIDWAQLAPAVIASIGLLFARDNNVTSEQAGAKG